MKVAEDHNSIDSTGAIASYIAVILMKMGRMDEVEEYIKKYALQIKEIEKRLAADQVEAATTGP